VKKSFTITTYYQLFYLTLITLTNIRNISSFLIKIKLEKILLLHKLRKFGLSIEQTRLPMKKREA